MARYGVGRHYPENGGGKIFLIVLTLGHLYNPDRRSELLAGHSLAGEQLNTLAPCLQVCLYNRCCLLLDARCFPSLVLTATDCAERSALTTFPDLTNFRPAKVRTSCMRARLFALTGCLQLCLASRIPQRHALVPSSGSGTQHRCLLLSQVHSNAFAAVLSVEAVARRCAAEPVEKHVCVCIGVCA